MASGPHTFAILGVFSAEHFQGNRLAVVAVRGNALPAQKKALIAKEFGFTGTVFIHDAPSQNLPRRVEIFTERGEELSFSGHCIIGTAHYVFQYCEPNADQDQDKPLTAVLMTKSGLVPVHYNMSRQVAACLIPHNFHLHAETVGFDKVLNVQPQLQIVPTIERCRGREFPVVSIVKGMTFGLIDLTDTPEGLAALEAAKAPELKLDDDWKSGYVGALYYKKGKSLLQTGEPMIHAIQARVITNGIEDPGTGSACSALACYLALNQDVTPEPKSKSGGDTSGSESAVDRGVSKPAEDSHGSKTLRTQRHVYAIQQGIEMGRGCTIAIEVDLVLEANNVRKVKSVTLSGKASFFGRGELVRV